MCVPAILSRLNGSLSQYIKKRRCRKGRGYIYRERESFSFTSTGWLVRSSRRDVVCEVRQVARNLRAPPLTTYHWDACMPSFARYNAEQAQAKTCNMQPLFSPSALFPLMWSEPPAPARTHTLYTRRPASP